MISLGIAPFTACARSGHFARHLFSMQQTFLALGAVGQRFAAAHYHARRRLDEMAPNKMKLLSYNFSAYDRRAFTRVAREAIRCEAFRLRWIRFLEMHTRAGLLLDIILIPFTISRRLRHCFTQDARHTTLALLAAICTRIQCNRYIWDVKTAR